MNISPNLINERLHELTDIDFERDSAVPEQAQLRSLLTQFMENEARSGSMDFGCITPLYVYRMWGGQYPIEEIENGLAELRKQGFMEL
jgi:hypothetical protein